MGQVEGRPFEYGFMGDDVTSHGGLQPIIEFAKSINFFPRVAELIPDSRRADRIKHSIEVLSSVLILGDICGYHNYSDHDDLRLDPVFKLLCRGSRRLKQGATSKKLPGKSELQRFIEGFSPEGRTTKETDQIREDFGRLLTELFADSFSTDPALIILDADATFIEQYGNQEGKERNNHYKKDISLLQTIYANSMPLNIRLLPGKHHCGFESTKMFNAPLHQLFQRFPEAEIVCRGDCGYQKDTTMKMIEEQQKLGYKARYVFALIGNQILQKAVQEHKTRIENYCQQNQCSKTEYVEFLYRTQNSWSKKRRVVAKLKCVYEEGKLIQECQHHFVVTNIPQSEADAKSIHQKGYCPRGNMENWIKASKHDMGAKNASLMKLNSNQFRLIHKFLGQGLLELFRRSQLKGTKFEKSTPATIREKFIKVAARIIDTSRRFMMSLAESCPDQKIIMNAVISVLLDVKQTTVRARDGPLTSVSC